MKIKQSLLAAVIGACIVGHAQAGFYVNDDAPAVTSARPEAVRRDKTLYVSFTGSRLQGTSRAELESAVEAVPSSDSIVITTFAKTAKQMASANRRVASVRAVLIRSGASPDRISANAELDPQADGLDTDVRVTLRAAIRPSIDAIRGARFVSSAPSQSLPSPTQAYPYPVASGVPTPPPQAPTTAPGAAQQGQSAAKLEFVKKIMAMASSKLISQESAIKLVNEYLANMAPVPGQDAPTNAGQGQIPVMPATPQIVPFGEVPRVWTLAANKSLRDNIREWALVAGYGEPAWTASNLYQVTYTSTYTGTFLEVLNQVSNTVPSLDFRVSRNSHRVDVVDHL